MRNNPIRKCEKCGKRTSAHILVPSVNKYGDDSKRVMHCCLKCQAEKRDLEKDR